MRSVPYSLAFCASLGLLACSSSTATTTAIVRPQLLSVLPEDFLGSITCSPDFGAAGDSGNGGASGDSSDADAGSGALVAKSYVATLTDVTPTGDGGLVNFVLASSPPTRCTQPVTFSYVVTNHYYTALVEAYTESAEDLKPFAAGSPLLLDAAGNQVNPTWSTHCGGYVASPAAGGAGGGAGSSGTGGSSGGSGGTAGIPGVIIYDTLTQTPHDCGGGLTPSKFTPSK